MNGKARWLVFAAGAVFTILMGMTGYMVNRLEATSDQLTQHRFEWIHPGAASAAEMAEANRRITEVETRQQALLKSLDRIENKLDRLLEK